ncbi:MAG: hypothetical protein LC624_06045, partial [Halobacteriales archaeon]|nr:hypothetical protein [Halobacteriales archaeon]
AGWYKGTATATLSWSDDASGVEFTYYTFDGGPPQVYSAPFAVPEGQHAVGYWSVDFSGKTEATHTATVKVDSVAPTSATSLSGTAGLNGWFVSPVTVSMSGSDATSGLAELRYRLDGSASLYGSPFTVSTDLDHALDSWAVDTAGNVEAEHHARVKIDRVAPTTTATLSGTLGNAGWYRSTVTVTFGATDATSGIGSTTSILDGGSPVVGGSISVPDEGTHTVAYFSTDVAGNVEVQHNVTFQVDKTPPATVLDHGAPAYVSGSDLYVTSASPFSLSATDALSGVAATKYSVVPGGPTSFTDYSVPFQLGGADGARTISYFSRDVAGNNETTKAQVAKVDNTPPDLQVARPRIGSLSVLQVYVELDSDWDYSPDLVETALGTGPFDPASHPPLNLPVALDPVHEQLRYAYILAGTVVPLTADATDPLVNGVASGIDHVDFLLDGVPFGSDGSAPYSVSWDTSPMTLGAHELRIVAVDHLGNAREIRVPLFLITTPRDAQEVQDALADLLPLDTASSPQVATTVSQETFLAMLNAMQAKPEPAK